MWCFDWFKHVEFDGDVHFEKYVKIWYKKLKKAQALKKV